MYIVLDNTFLAVAWKLGINDPTLIAWVIVAAYMVATWYCWRVGRRIKAASPIPVNQESSGKLSSLSHAFGTTSAALWFLLSAIMLVMGANKQLDLHGPIVPRIQKALFWNDYWSVNAILFVVAVSLLILIGSVVGIRLLMRQSYRLQFAYISIACMLVLEAIRFSPNRFSKVLVYHLLNEDESWLHMHTIELLELFVLLLICWLARSTMKYDLNQPTVNDVEISAQAALGNQA